MSMKDYREIMFGELDDLYAKFQIITNNSGEWPERLRGRAFGYCIALMLAGADQGRLAEYDVYGFK